MNWRGVFLFWFLRGGKDQNSWNLYLYIRCLLPIHVSMVITPLLESKMRIVCRLPGLAVCVHKGGVRAWTFRNWNVWDCGCKLHILIKMSEIPRRIYISITTSRNFQSVQLLSSIPLWTEYALTLGCLRCLRCPWYQLNKTQMFKRRDFYWSLIYRHVQRPDKTRTASQGLLFEDRALPLMQEHTDIQRRSSWNSSGSSAALDETITIYTSW